MGETVRLWPKLMTCARKTDEKIEGRTDERIAVKIAGWIGEKTDEPIAKWIGEKIEEKIDNSIDGKIAGRIGRWTGVKIVKRIIEQAPVVNFVGLIGPIMLPANMAEKAETMPA